jgi:hypothetical protein
VHGWRRGRVRTRRVAVSSPAEARLGARTGPTQA